MYHFLQLVVEFAAALVGRATPVAVGDTLDVVPDAVVVTDDGVGNGILVVIVAEQTAQVHGGLVDIEILGCVAVGTGVPVDDVGVYPTAEVKFGT